MIPGVYISVTSVKKIVRILKKKKNENFLSVLQETELGLTPVTSWSL